jgi:dTDP-4-dehydrorhamnose 3,5-epimerase|tara:strand:- start:166 stop:699 length:534 start_codon:yes stop_codon:yes gene_type:complete
MKIKKTKFKDLKIIKGKIFYDDRGFFKEIYQKKILKKHNPIFWCMSKSKKNVFRGLHLQKNKMQEKFVTVIKGKILDIVVDLRHNSKTFGKHFKIILSDKNAKSILIPAGFAHGFMGLEIENIILYSNNKYRSQKDEMGLLWSDKNLKINLPKKKLIISKKDKANMELAEFLKKLKK